MNLLKRQQLSEVNKARKLSILYLLCQDQGHPEVSLVSWRGSLASPSSVKHLLSSLHARHGFHILTPVTYFTGQNLFDRKKHWIVEVKSEMVKVMAFNSFLKSVMTSVVTFSCFISSFLTDFRFARRSMEPLCLEPSKALIISSADTRTFLRAGFLNFPPRSWTFNLSSLI